ncbi:MAG: SIMPL domain-containing protein [Bacillota bacterium]
MLDLVVASGADRVRGISFGLSEPRSWRDEALELAVADARWQAG